MADSTAKVITRTHLQSTLLHKQRLQLANVNVQLPVFRRLTAFTLGSICGVFSSELKS